MRLLRDLECQNPECGAHTVLKDVMAERGSDGTVVMTSSDGSGDITNPACESCGKPLMIALSRVHIGRTLGVSPDGIRRVGQMEVGIPIDKLVGAEARLVCNEHGSERRGVITGIERDEQGRPVGINIGPASDAPAARQENLN